MKYIETLDEIDWSDVPLTEIKYKRFSQKFIDNIHPKFREVIERMLSVKPPCEYDLCLVDIKVRDLVKDQFSCFVEDFHYDWVKNFDHKNKHEFHVLYTNVNGTEFENDRKCKDNSIYTFGRELHKGTLMNEDVRRVLIRISYVDNKAPKR